MMRLTRIKTFFLGLLAAALLTGASAMADPSVDLVATGKQSGQIGEQCDGYLGQVPGAQSSAAMQAAMNEINIKRKAAYVNLARSSGVSVEDVARVTAEKLLARVGHGEKVRDCSGHWVTR